MLKPTETIIVFFFTINFLHFFDHVSSTFGPLLNPDGTHLFGGGHLLPALHGGGGLLGRMNPTVALTTDEQEYLDAHNAFRAKRSVPPLEWDTGLVEYAKNWGVARSQDCDYTHHSEGPYGENMMWEQYDEMMPTDVVNQWGDEEVNWDRANRACKCGNRETATCKCSHYVAMVWKTTRRLGCATTTCAGEKGILIVCEYEPRGQFRGEDPLNPIH